MTAIGVAGARSFAAVFDRLVGDRARTGLQRRIDRAVQAQGRALEARLIAQPRAEQSSTSSPRDAGTRFSLEVLYGGGTAADRLLDPARYRTLHDELLELAGSDGSAPAIGWSMQQAYRSLLVQEMTGLGRIAGTTDTIIGKLVAPPLLGPRRRADPGDRHAVRIVLTLAGAPVPAGGPVPHPDGDRPARRRADPTGRPTGGRPVRNAGDPSVAERNLASGDLAADEVSVLEGYSTDDQVRFDAARQQYAVVVIDGDHSEEGVYEDLWWVETVTLPGAVVIMDDFGDRRWPGVEAATRRYLTDGGRLELVGRAATSAYLRMPAQAEAS